MNHTQTACSPTMTLHELADAFRANHISVGEDALAQMIIERRLPFAVGASGKRRKLIIFRAAFYKWLEEKTDEKAVRN